MKMLKNPIVKAKGRVWTVEKLAAFATRSRGDEWARTALNYVILGAYTLDEMLKLAADYRRGFVVYFGKPTRKYPQGFAYSPEKIIRELAERGMTIGYNAPFVRIRRLEQDAGRGEDSLFAGIQEKKWNPNNSGRLEALEMGKMTDKGKKLDQLLQDWSVGLIGQNEYLRRADALEV